MVKYRFPGLCSWTFRLMGLKWVCISHQLSGVWGSTARNGHPLPDRPRHFASVERGSRQGCHCVLWTVGQRRPGQGPCSQPRASAGPGVCLLLSPLLGSPSTHSALPRWPPCSTNHTKPIFHLRASALPGPSPRIPFRCM